MLARTRPRSSTTSSERARSTCGVVSDVANEAWLSRKTSSSVLAAVSAKAKRWGVMVRPPAGRTREAFGCAARAARQAAGVGGRARDGPGARAGAAGDRAGAAGISRARPAHLGAVAAGALLRGSGLRHRGRALPGRRHPAHGDAAGAANGCGVKHLTRPADAR